MSINKTTAILLFSVFSIASKAQLTELGAFVGGTNFIGDVGHYGFHVPQGMAYGINLRHQFDYHYSIRGQFTYGMIANDDAMSTFDWRRNRNLHFRSAIWEGSLMTEFNFFEYVTGQKKRWQTPYIFAGVGMFSFNPQAQVDGEWVDLQPLGTEGQGSSQTLNPLYSTVALNFMFGMGYRLSLGPSFSVTFETGFRSTSTDYLDDVSTYYPDPALLAQERNELAAALSNRSLDGEDKTGRPRGNSQNNDWYIYSGITIYISLTPKNERCTTFW